MSVESDKAFFKRREIPLFTGAIMFISGNVIAWQIEIGPVAWLAIASVLLILSFTIRRRIIGMTYLPGALMLCTGGLTTSTYNSTVTTAHTHTEDLIVLNVKPYDKGARLMVRLPATPLTYKKKAIIYLRSPGNTFLPGDIINIRSRFDPIEPAQFQFEFDKQRYWLGNGVTLQAFAKDQEVVVVGRSISMVVRRACYEVSNSWRSLIATLLPHRQTQGMAKAMVLGDKGDLDESVISSYKRAGVMHILAISGLHIGIVAALLILVVGKPGKSNHFPTAFLRTVLICAALWAYIFVSGLSPSASRAATMCTIYFAGKLFARSANSLNVIGLTALIFLVVHPYLIFNLSFQFSFVALLGIILWGLPLSRILLFKYKMAQSIWSIISVSIGAQMMLLPLLLYYFGTVSIISPLTSVLAIPYAFVLVAGVFIGSAITIIFPLAGSLIGHVLVYTTQFFGVAVETIAELPFAQITTPEIASSTLCALCLLMFCMTMRLHSEHPAFQLMCFPIAALLVISVVRSNANRVSDKGIVLTQYDHKIPAFDIHYRGGCISSVKESIHGRWIAKSSLANCRSFGCKHSISVSPHGKYEISNPTSQVGTPIRVHISAEQKMLPSQINITD